MKIYSLFLSLFFVSTAFSQPNMGRMLPHEVAFFVQDLNTGEVLAEHNADTPMNPASVMKLVTSYAALDTLGADFRWKTEWRVRTPMALNNGVLDGNLYWIGSGDPTMEQNDLIAMQNALRNKGIQQIGGKIVLDSSAWSNAGSAENFGRDAGRAFTIAPDPHMLSYKVVWVGVERNAAGDLAVVTKPPLPNIEVHNTAQFVSGSNCGNIAKILKAHWDGAVLHIGGRIPVACENQALYVNMLNPQEFAFESFVGQWQQQGGSGARLFLTGKTPDDSEVVASHYSVPLSDAIRTMNKQSDNLFARSIFLTLGANQAGDTVENAKKTVINSFKQAGIHSQGLVMENGSGLSREERVTARTLGTMLYRAYYNDAFNQQFIDSLPIAGYDGTLRRRLRDVGGLRMKTGTLKDVRALAGFRLPENPNEPPLGVVVMINSPKSGAYLGDMDDLVRSLVALPHKSTPNPFSPYMHDFAGDPLQTGRITESQERKIKEKYR
ncbi:MAG: D-alanyl-D-alanine carboxypeptidase/D-alanyl-D-alanine-endopeptidase [Neisseriaceae bacterium]|nr:D-alanyl-D-alanine carboxypeptidase/D-alanyl-D-alanine-endopeptidase [Neisseriaceae bacterium]